MPTKIRKLGEVTDVRDGTHDSPKYQTCGFPLVTTRCFVGDSLDITQAKLISGEDYDAINVRSKVDQYDILISMIGTVGAVYQETSAVVRYAIKNVGLIKCHGDAVLSDWIFYWLKSDLGIQAISERLRGTTQKFISLTDLRHLPIGELPNNSIMQERVSILKKFDAKIKLNQQINKNLLKLMENFHCKLLSGAVLNHQYKRTTILEVADSIVTGKTPSTKQSKNYGKGIPFITIPDMQGKAFVGITQKSLTRDGASTQPKKEIPAYSLNISCIGTVGLVTINPTAAHTNQQINSVVVPKDKLWELFFELRSLKKTMMNAASGGTTILNMNKNTFSHLKVNLLSDSLREQFNCVVEPMFEQILVNNQQNMQLANLRNILLPRLLAGDIDLSNIETVMNNA